jgi:hypothetical protein
MLSRPPAELASAMSRSPARSRSGSELRTAAIWSSPIIDVSPSEHISTTSPARTGKVQVSTSTSFSMPSARVMIERWGCSAACSSVSLPRRTSSSTSEWSWVSRVSDPSRKM